MNDNGEKENVVLSNDDFTQIEKYLRNRLCLALCPLLFSLLKIPFKVTIFLNLLLLVRENDSSFTITTKDDEIIVNESKRTIRRYRDELKKFMSNHNLKIIDISYNSSRTGEGTTYRLNFLQSLEKIVGEFLKANNLSLQELLSLIKFLENYRGDDTKRMKSTNAHILMENVRNNLFKLEGEPKIDLTEQYQY